MNGKEYDPMRADYHLHTATSPDCDVPALEQIEACKALGLTDICITDHMEIAFPAPGDWSMDVPAYRRMYESLEYSGIDVKFGVEAGFPNKMEDMGALEAQIRLGNFDFVLASCHIVEGVDPYYPEYFEGITAQEGFRKYLETINRYVRVIDENCFSAIGHIDYPTKGCPYPDLRLHYSYCPDEIDELFRYLIPRGKCIEINTSAYRKLGELPIPGEDWLRRYAELGGEYVTFGSDAHYTHHVGLRFDEAAEMARRAGIKYYATFDRMKPILHKL